MDERSTIRLGWTASQSRESRYDHRNIRPYSGVLTHSWVGILIIIGLIIQAPGAIFFYAFSIAIGAVVAVLLWLRRR